MSNRRFSFDFSTYDNQSSMDYINRFFHRRSPALNLHSIHHSANPNDEHPDASRYYRSDHRPHSGTYRRRKHHRHKMMSFNGPWSKDLNELKTSVQLMPEQYKSSFTSASKTTLGKICDPDMLHIWESNSDIDSLLQLTSVIAKLCDLGVREEKGTNDKDGNMLIIVEESRGRNNFARICQLVEYLTCADGKKHLEGTVVTFGTIVIVRAWDNTVLSGQVEAMEKTTKRINTAIERIFSSARFKDGKRKIVWHHGPVIHFLLHWVNNTKSTLRSALSAITITGSLDLTNGIAPSTAGRPNTLSQLQRLGSYAKKLSIPIVFLDSPSQMITFKYLGTYMYYFAYYITTFLPTALARSHLYKAQDELVTFAFRLRAASDHKYGSDAVRMVQKYLDASKAKHWARMCVAKETYEKTKCRSAGRDDAIHHAVQIADSPFAQLNSGNGVPAFARLAVGPAAAGSNQVYTAAPVSIDFACGRLRPSFPTAFHVLTPAPEQDLEKITNHIQGTMMAVLERVRQEKGNPLASDMERGMWKAVVKACTWALDGCGDKLPKGLDEKVKFVREKLREGTWSFALGVPAEGKADGLKKEVVAPMPEPNRTYGFGMAQGQGQQIGQGMYASGQAQYAQQMPQYAQGQGQGVPMGVDPAMYAQSQGYGQVQAQGGVPVGYGQQGMKGGYEQGHHQQNMGGPW